MDPHELVATWNRIYFEDVKPALLAGDHLTAIASLQHIRDQMQLNYETIFLGVHVGGNYLAQARALLERLHDRRVTPGAWEVFEAYMAQTNLPKIDSRPT